MDELQQALEQCKQEVEQAHALAYDALVEAKEAIEAEGERFRFALNRFEADGFQDSEFRQKVSASASELVGLVSRLHREHIDRLRMLRTRQSAFQICLFGRTMAGKSTLMEILTEGDGSSIGNGAQRKTTDVRSYPWNRLSVLDVPGVAAFGGKDDDEVALKAAAQSDMVLFLITDDAPQPAEGEHLAGVQAMGLPVVGVCNVKKGIRESELHQPKLRARFTSEIRARLEGTSLQKAIDTLYEMASKRRETAAVDFTACHLRARFLADRLGDREVRDEVAVASNVDALLARIVEIVRSRGSFIRMNSFVGKTAAFMAESGVEAADRASRMEELQATLERAAVEFREWVVEFLDRSKDEIESGLAAVFDDLRSEVSPFVEEHAESKDAARRWAQWIDEAEVRNRIELIAAGIANELEVRVGEIGGEVAVACAEIRGRTRSRAQGATRFDWQRTARWGVALAETAAVLGLFFATGPPGWALLAVGGGALMLNLGFGWVFDSKAEKLARARELMAKELNLEIDIAEAGAKRELINWTVSELARKSIRIVEERIQSASDLLQEICALQRSVARDLFHHGSELAKHIVARALQIVGGGEAFETIARVAYAGGAYALVLRPTAEMGHRMVAQLAEILQRDVVVVSETEEDSSVAYQILSGFCAPQDIEVDGDRLLVRVAETSELLERRVKLAQQLATRRICIAE